MIFRICTIKDGWLPPQEADYLNWEKDDGTILKSEGGKRNKSWKHGMITYLKLYKDKKVIWHDRLENIICWTSKGIIC